MTAVLRVVRDDESGDVKKTHEQLVSEARQWLETNMPGDVKAAREARNRMILALNQQGYTQRVIADAVECSQYTVNRVLIGFQSKHGHEIIKDSRGGARQRKDRENQGEVKTEVRENRSEVKGISNIGYDGQDYSKPPKPDPELRVHNAMMKWRKVFLDVYGEFIDASIESRKMRRTCVDFLKSEAEEFLKIADEFEEKLKNGGNEIV